MSSGRRGRERQIHLNLFLVRFGIHPTAGRQPSTDPTEATSFSRLASYVEQAERAKFDSVLMADYLAASHTGTLQLMLDPLTLLSGFATRTSRIGLIGTVSTTFMPPFHLARKFASLDHMSGGRAGWNIVTSTSDAQARNFGLDAIPTHDDRYEMAREYLDLVLDPWDSWDDDALVLDQQGGVYLDPMKVHPVEHAGTYYQCEGPLNVSRPPQGHPVLVQAGSSPAGRDFAARYAELVFAAQPSLAYAQRYYADVKARAREYGRDVIILPGVATVVGSTEDEASEEYERLNSLLDIDAGLREFSVVLEREITRADLDGPLPMLPETIRGYQGRSKMIADVAQQEQLTVRQLIERFSLRGNPTFVGTGEQVADQMEAWFTQGAADGFTIAPAVNYPGLERFIANVIPHLQRRGLFPTEYTGATLRDSYGLARAPSRRRAASSTLDRVG
jgi:N-acetyl-S-(2-succino)cysteine monooxygenase